MKNFTTYEEFLPVLKSSGNLVITTDYNRPDSFLPFVNGVVLNRMKSEGLVSVDKVGPGRVKVALRK